MRIYIESLSNAGFTYSPLVIFEPAAKNDHNICCYAEWTDPFNWKNYTDLIPTEHSDRKIFGPGTFRISRKNSVRESVVLINPETMRVYPLNDHVYDQTGIVEWEKPRPIHKLVIYNKAVFEKTFNNKPIMQQLTTVDKYRLRTVSNQISTLEVLFSKFNELDIEGTEFKEEKTIIKTQYAELLAAYRKLFTKLRSAAQ